ncbi:hypothetical protein TNCV_1212351 [Trichonephila clavipes]|nr:hypothetical protein TNCV_1212351 [Trichonephila clavipes]
METSLLALTVANAAFNNDAVSHEELKHQTAQYRFHGVRMLPICSADRQQIVSIAAGVRRKNEQRSFRLSWFVHPIMRFSPGGIAAVRILSRFQQKAVRFGGWHVAELTGVTYFRLGDGSSTAADYRDPQTYCLLTPQYLR